MFQNGHGRFETAKGFETVSNIQQPLEWNQYLIGLISAGGRIFYLKMSLINTSCQCKRHRHKHIDKNLWSNQPPVRLLIDLTA